LDRYLVHRAGKGLSPTTLHSDALCAKAFLRWCVKNDLLERSLLAGYEIRKAPAPARYMPSDEEIRGLLRAVHDYWDPAKNPDVRYHPVQRRIFHRDRNTAILIGLLDSACRIGELLHLRVDDYRPQERQITIRESKGRGPRRSPYGSRFTPRSWQTPPKAETTTGCSSASTAAWWIRSRS
jgi:integrase